LKKQNVNVIVADWSKANGLPYTQATANSQVVGADIAIFINNLISNSGCYAAHFHCIGHSLGKITIFLLKLYIFLILN